MDVAEIISTARKRSGLTRRELEKKAGVSYGHVAKWENRVTGITMDNFVAVMAACGHEIIIREKDKPYYRKR